MVESSSPVIVHVLCSWARYFALIVSLITQENKWVPASFGGNQSECCTPSRDSSNISSRFRLRNPVFSVHVPLFFAAVIWTCVWIDAVLSEAAMSPTWWTRTASLLLVFRLRCVKSAMCPRQMATLRFPPL